MLLLKNSPEKYSIRFWARNSYATSIFFLIISVLLLSGCTKTDPAVPTCPGAATPVNFIEPAKSCSLFKTFYVSASGNDASMGSKDAPWKTLQKARDEIRRINRTMKGDIVVSIREGEYFLDNTLEFSEQDSGFNGCRVIYRNENKRGSARFWGGTSAEWTPYKGEIWKTVIPSFTKSSSEAESYIETLYEKGMRAVKARYPKRSQDNPLPYSHAPYLYSDVDSESEWQFQFKDSDSKTGLSKLLEKLAAEPEGRADLQAYIWSGGNQSWFSEIVPLKSWNLKTRHIGLENNTRYPVRERARYYLQGALEFLTQAGEFYFDSKTRELFYWPRASTPDWKNVIVPQLKTVLSIKGESERNPVHHLVFEGLALGGTNFTKWYRFGWARDGESNEKHIFSGFDRQIDTHDNRTGTVFLQNTEHVEIKFNHIFSSGYSGIYALFNNSFSHLYGNKIEHTGLHGIKIQGNYPGEGFYSHHNRIANNLILGFGELAGGANGIDISSSGYNEVDHNQIQDGPKSGLLLFAAAPLCGPLVHSRENRFHHNLVQRVAQDGAEHYAIYFGGLSNDNTAPNYINQTIVRDIKTDPSALVSEDFPPGALWFDGDTFVQYVTDFQAINTQNIPYFNIFSIKPVLTNVSWLPGFKIELMSPHIGLMGDFPSEYQL